MIPLNIYDFQRTIKNESRYKPSILNFFKFLKSGLLFRVHFVVGYAQLRRALAFC